MTGRCPEPTVLTQIGRGDEGGSCTPELAAHIEECQECRAFLERRLRGRLEPLNETQGATPAAAAILPEIDGFTIERELGRGAMGAVYLARRHGPRRQLALKLLPGGRRAGESDRRVWQREAEAASSVRHPHIVTLHDAFLTDEWFVLVLEYVGAGTLAARLVQPLPPRTAARFVELVARAVHHIHQSGLLHLDLKPSNILLDGEPGANLDAVVPKVADFGIARRVEPSAGDTYGAGAGGTPGYMAPEQISRPRSEMTATADIHALGAILYHALTGKPPFQAATVLETIDHARRIEPVPPRRLNPAIPRDLETVCLKCLRKEASGRYASAESLAQDLSRWLDGRPITARPVSAAERAWRWCRRQPVVSGLAAAFAVTLAISVTTVIVFWRQAEENYRTSNQMLNEIIELTMGGEHALPRALTPEIVAPLLQRERERLLLLSARSPNDGALTRQLVRVEDRLCLSLMQIDQFELCRTMLLDSLARLNTLAVQRLDDDELDVLRSGRFGYLSQVSEAVGKKEDSVAYLRLAVHTLEGREGNDAKPEFVTSLLRARHDLGWALCGRREHQEACRLFAANHRLAMSQLLEDELLKLPAIRFFAHVDWKLFRDSFDPGAPEEKSIGADRLALLRSPADPTQAPEQWATIALTALASDDADPDVAARQSAMDGRLAIDNLAALASTIRRQGHTEEAGRIASRLLALGKRLAQTYRQQPASHLALSDAYLQFSKEGWKSEDLASIEMNVTFALDAAHKALLLDMTSEDSQQTVYRLQQRLAKLQAGK
jgi:Protein kinase domain